MLRNENHSAAICAHTQVPQPEFNLFCWLWEQHPAGKIFWERGFPVVLDMHPRRCQTVALPVAEHSYFQAGVGMDYFTCTCQWRHTFETDFTVDLPASTFFSSPFFFSFSPYFYFSVCYSCATAEPSIPPELVLDKRTLLCQTWSMGGSQVEGVFKCSHYNRYCNSVHLGNPHNLLLW